MSCYFIAYIDIHDEEEYQKYLKDVDEVFSKFNGKYLAVDAAPAVLEGTWQYNRAVLMQFPNESAFRRWYESPEYQSILKHRLNAARCDSILINASTNGGGVSVRRDGSIESKASGLGSKSNDTAVGE